jgi:hypothetical protein
MELKTLIETADKAYDEDGLVLQYFMEPAGEHGDGLAKFIAEELRETYDSEVSTEEQIAEALRVMLQARDQLCRVIAGFEEKPE